jgi:hypothetical protein
MCLSNPTPWKRATRPIRAFKVVTAEDYRSPIHPDGRSLQPGYLNCGRVLTYKPGTLVRARRPGIYLYKHPVDAVRVARNYSYWAVAVEIPRGAYYREGKVDHGQGICATSVRVLDENVHAFSA